MEIWKYMRYNLIREYYDRSFLIPPFTLLHHLTLFFIWLKQMACFLRFCTSANRIEQFNIIKREWEKMKQPSSKLTQTVDEGNERQNLLQFEFNCMLIMKNDRNSNDSKEKE